MARGQVSVFIIIGVILLFAVSAVILVPDYENDNDIVDSTEVDVYMTECTKNKAERAMAVAGKTGGKFKEEVMFTAYLDEMPTIKGVKSNVSEIIKRGIVNCSKHEFPGKNVTTGNLNVSVEFNTSTKIYVKNFYQVRTPGSVQNKPKAKFELDIPFMKVYKTASAIQGNDFIHDKGRIRKKGLKIEGMDKGDYELWAVTADDYVFAFAKR